MRLSHEQLVALDHSPGGGSSAARLMACPGSVAANLHSADVTADYTERGTVAHELAELTLKNAGMSVAKVRAIADDPRFDALEDEDIAAVRMFVRHVRQLAATAGAQLHVEVSFAMQTPGHPRLAGLIYGKADALVWLPATNTLHVLDYKHGEGIEVNGGETNMQNPHYAVGAIQSLGVPAEVVVMHVVQPRCNPEEPIKTWEVKADTLFHDFLPRFLSAAEASLDPDAPRIPGEHCQFCKHRGVCVEAAQSAVSSINPDADGPDDYVFPEPSRLDDVTVAQIHTKSVEVRGFLRAVERALVDRVQNGTAQNCGFKLVQALPRRQWKAGVTADTLRKTLADYGVTDAPVEHVQLLSPAEFEQVLRARIEDGEKALNAVATMEIALTRKQSSGLTIAPDTDRRPAVNPRAVATAGLSGLKPPEGE